LRTIRRPFFCGKNSRVQSGVQKVKALGAGRGLPMARPSHLGQLAALPSPAHALILSPCASLQSPLTRKRTAGWWKRCSGRWSSAAPSRPPARLKIERSARPVQRVVAGSTCQPAKG